MALILHSAAGDAREFLRLAERTLRVSIVDELAELNALRFFERGRTQITDFVFRGNVYALKIRNGIRSRRTAEKVASAPVPRISAYLRYDR